MDLPSFANGRYVVGTIMQGGMGVVYQLYPSWHVAGPIALKTFNGIASEAAFAREVSTWMGLAGHRNIAEPIWHGSWRGRPSVASHWQPRTLSNQFASTLGVRGLRSIFAGVAKGLAYAHDEHRVLHRDIKPGNILVDRDGVAKITDWGIATALMPATLDLADDVGGLRSARATRSGLSGSPAYMAPELFAGAVASPRTEIYALGVTMFEALTGEHPYAGPETGHRLTARLRTGPLDGLVRDVRDEFGALILAMVSRNPAERPLEYHEVLRALGEAQGTSASRDNDAAITEAQYLRRQGRPAEARLILDNAIDADQSDPALWNVLAVSLAGSDPKAAEAALVRAVELLRQTGGMRGGRTYPDPAINLFRFARASGRYDEAANLLRLVASFPIGPVDLTEHYHEMAWLDMWEGRSVDAAAKLADYCARRPLTIREPVEWLFLSALTAGDEEMHARAPLIAKLLPAFAEANQHALLVAGLHWYVDESTRRSLWSTVSEDQAAHARGLLSHLGEDASQLGPPPSANIPNITQECLSAWFNEGLYARADAT